MRLRHVYAVSDLHADHLQNMQLIEAIAQSGKHQRDVLLVAGDVSEKLDVWKMAMETLAGAFGVVFFVPGNHDLWVRRDGADGKDSLAKLDRLLASCHDIGVLTSPHCLQLDNAAVDIHPIFSFYHSSFDVEPDVEELRLPSVTRAILDYTACRWPPPLTTGSYILAETFDRMNDALLHSSQPIHTAATPLRVHGSEKGSCSSIISFSHFLPRIELCPEKRFLIYPPLMKAVGSNLLGARVDSLASKLHVFGHTHFGWDTSLDGIRYIQAPLGYPRERLTRSRAMIIGQSSTFPLLKVFDGVLGCESASYSASWSDYYAENARNPSLTFPAPWVLDYYRLRAPKRIKL